MHSLCVELLVNLDPMMPKAYAFVTWFFFRYFVVIPEARGFQVIMPLYQICKSRFVYNRRFWKLPFLAWWDPSGLHGAENRWLSGHSALSVGILSWHLCVPRRVGKVGNYPGEKHLVITGEKSPWVNTPSGEKPKFGKFPFQSKVMMKKLL